MAGAQRRDEWYSIYGRNFVAEASRRAKPIVNRFYCLETNRRGTIDMRRTRVFLRFRIQNDEKKRNFPVSKRFGRGIRV